MGVGVTRQGELIEALSSIEALDPSCEKRRLLLVAGLSGADDSSRAALAAAEWMRTSAEAAAARDRYLLTVIACANPQAPGRPPLEGVDKAPAYPPAGEAYTSTEHAHAQYLWRWIGMHGPDLVVVIESGDGAWFVPRRSADEALTPLLENWSRSLRPQYAAPADSLAAQLPLAPPANVGVIPAVAVRTSDEDGSFLKPLLEALERGGGLPSSPARRELNRRWRRTPLEISRELAEHYGGRLDEVMYIPAMAAAARLKLGDLEHDSRHRQAIEEIVAPYVSGEKPTAPESGSALSGHLLFCDLAESSEADQRQRYLALARQAADLGLDGQGRPRPQMPFHLEMSDAFFMGGPILSRVGRLTGDVRYFDACVNHLGYMTRLTRRSDGLYRHSPLDETAWGRGNGFVAMGTAMVLADLPASHPQRAALLAEHVRHLTALRDQQDPTGCWRQVIDRPGAYRELTATCMIGWAMREGVQRGWLDGELFGPCIERAWMAVRQRVGRDGELFDVCTGTGKQTSLRAYYDRPAVLGRDDRGGAMALWFAVAMAGRGNQ